MTEPTPNDARPLDSDCVEQTGPWPFVTRRVYRLADPSRRIWSSRHHRKGLLVRDLSEIEQLGSILIRCLWLPGKLNWWIGIVFTIGSLLFALASVLSLSPSFAGKWSLDAEQINAIFFAGSIPFTTAAYLQLYQAANVSPFWPDGTSAGRRRSLIGWRPFDIGWLSAALQFVGTILFNFNTFDAMIPAINWFQQDLLIWVPNIVGSILFLASGHLAFIETCHSHWSWQPKSISWWVVFTGLLGCMGFMISALFAISFPTAHPAAITLSIGFTLLGAIGFLVSSLLMLPETVDANGMPYRPNIKNSHRIGD
ncbi:hypothetical protein [Novipirellula aureliae]|nr:hypothetical protein [Novipirellula aureliae]